MNELKAYQVGENDIVAAYNESQAISILTEFAGGDVTELMDKDDVTEKYFDMDICDEEGNITGKLGDIMKDVVEPEYLFGWE